MFDDLLGDLKWRKRGLAVFPLDALHLHTIILGSSGTGKTETILRMAATARAAHRLQVIYPDAKGETKRDEEASQDNAARFVAAMHQAGAVNVFVYPSLHYHGWQGTPTELKNRLLAVVDYTEPFYGDFASLVLDLALNAPTTPRTSSHFLANLRLDRLKAIYKDNKLEYQQILGLDKDLLTKCEMRYQVFFRAMQGTLDGTLDLANCDAAYLRVRGFTLRNEAPRLGRFLVADFMHYIAERRKPGVQTLFIIDEYNALRMQELTSVLFEQCRSFGGSLVISSQSYAGLGDPKHADRLLGACSTHILHACSDPFPITKRAGKRWYLSTTYTEDEEGNQRISHKPGYDWRVSEQDVIEQSAGQTFWIYRGREQQVQIARIAITSEQIQDAWQEIKRQEETQRKLSEEEARRKEAKQREKASTSAKGKKKNSDAPKSPPKEDNFQKEQPPDGPPPSTPDDDEPDRL